MLSGITRIVDLEVFCSFSIQIYNVYIDDEMDDDEMDDDD